MYRQERPTLRKHDIAPWVMLAETIGGAHTGHLGGKGNQRTAAKRQRESPVIGVITSASSGISLTAR